MPRTSKKSPSVKSTARYLEPINSHPGPGPAIPADTLLEILANTINALRKRVAEGLVEIGFRLTEAKALAGHGNWLPWLEHNFGWTERTAQRYMSVYELVAKYDIMSDLDLPMTTLVQLAAPSTPPEAVEEVIGRVEAGENPTGAEVAATIGKAKVARTGKKAEKPVHRMDGPPSAAFLRAQKRSEIAKMNAECDARIDQKKAGRQEERQSDHAYDLGCLQEDSITKAVAELEDFCKRYTNVLALHDFILNIEQDAKKIGSHLKISGFGLPDAVDLINGRYGAEEVLGEVLERNPSLFGIKEAVAALIKKYGPEIVSNAVVDHNP